MVYVQFCLHQLKIQRKRIIKSKSGQMKSPFKHHFLFPQTYFFLITIFPITQTNLDLQISWGKIMKVPKIHRITIAESPSFLFSSQYSEDVSGTLGMKKATKMNVINIKYCFAVILRCWKIVTEAHKAIFDDFKIANSAFRAFCKFS